MKFSYRSALVTLPALVAILSLAFTRKTYGETESGSIDGSFSAVVSVKPGKILREFSPSRLGGSNIAAWNANGIFESRNIQDWMTDLHASYIRMPGGSWSDAFYWNGNGVRSADGKVDPTKIGADGYPAIDYSSYTPSFLASSKTLGPTDSGWHGHIDALSMHQFINSVKSEALVTVNVGTGRAIDAAEWVRFANVKNQFHVKLWEMGNELDGSWEPGHYLKDGKTELTGSLYAQRVREFSKAMKAIDPTIKVGGAATGVGSKSFTRDMLAEAGDSIDFVSIHTYFGSPLMSDDENFTNVAKVIGKEVSQARQWINEYQPDRKDKIEIGYTEWNLGPGGDPFASDMFSGIWASLMLSEFARNGVDFATQWDSFTHVRSMVSGHGLILGDKEPFDRKAQYFALQLWNKLTGNRLIESSSNQNRVFAFATESDDAITIQLLNTDRDRQANIKLDLADFKVSQPVKLVSLTSRQYFWNRLKNEPSWSNDPEVSYAADPTQITLPPFSIVYAILPKKTGASDNSSAKLSIPQATISFLLPDEIYAGDKIEGWVQAKVKGTNEPFPAVLEPAKLSADGNIQFDRTQVRLSEACGRFSMISQSPGTIVIHAKSGDYSAEFPVNVKESIPRPLVFWNFVESEPTDKKLYGSDWEVTSDASARANKFVAKIDLPSVGVLPETKSKPRTLFQIHKFPENEKLNRTNIRGAVFDMKTSADFKCDDPDASVQVIMQSPSDYWMILGSVPLKQSEKWGTFKVITKNEKYIQAMPLSYNLWLVLKSNKPVSGSVYFDRIGLMVR